jgi:hypothetical protein
VMNYKVVVRGGTIIYDGESLTEANRSFENFVSQSKELEVLVTLFQDSNIVRQWYRHLNPDLLAIPFLLHLPSPEVHHIVLDDS